MRQSSQNSWPIFLFLQTIPTVVAALNGTQLPARFGNGQSSSASQVYYRIHVSVIKLTLNDFPDVETSVLQHHLDVAAKGPFHHPELDQDTPRASVSKMDATVSGDSDCLSNGQRSR